MSGILSGADNGYVYGGVIMKSFGWCFFCVSVGIIFGITGGADFTKRTYDRHITICSSNDFSYQKCGELYGWDLK